MTEQEAIKALTYLKAACTNKSDTVKALDTAIKALIETKKYREIGTVEECRTMDSIIDKVERNELAKIVDEWILYKKIGTLEECRENKDKQEPKKVTDLHVDDFTCPNCGYEDTTLDYKQVPKYCRNCGQALYD